MSDKQIEMKNIVDINETEKGSPSDEVGAVDFQHGEIEVLEEKFGEVHLVKQGLHQRHIQVNTPSKLLFTASARLTIHNQMIAIAGTIGTGLFLSSGKAVARSGPLGALLAYSVMGAAASAVVFAVGEMGALMPLNGGIVRYAEEFLDPAMSFANGWNLVYSYLTSIPAEICAAAVLVEFWVTV